jgi:hypothetical protein
MRLNYGSLLSAVFDNVFFSAGWCSSPVDTVCCFGSADCSNGLVKLSRYGETLVSQLRAWRLFPCHYYSPDVSDCVLETADSLLRSNAINHYASLAALNWSGCRVVLEIAAVDFALVCCLSRLD